MSPSDDRVPRSEFIHEAQDDVARVFGELFPKDKWVKVDHLPQEHQAVLASNPTFEAKGEVPEPKADPEPAK